MTEKGLKDTSARAHSTSCTMTAITVGGLFLNCLKMI